MALGAPSDTEPVLPAAAAEPIPAGAAPRALRITLRTGLLVLFLGLAVYYLLPQADQLERTLDALGAASPTWLLLAAVASGATFLASTVSVVGAAGRPLPLLRTGAVELAAAALNRVTPAGLGRAAVLTRYYERTGMSRTEAVSAMGVNLAAGAAVHVVALSVTGALLVLRGFEVPRSHHLPQHWPWLLALVAALLAVGLAAGTTRAAGRVLQPVTRAVGQLWSALRRPRSAVALLGGAVLTNAAFVLALWAALHAFGGRSALVTVAFVYLAASAAASAAPTPGGLGAMEAALLAGMTRFGAATGPAVAGILAYRLLTYWAPVLPGLWCLHRLKRSGRL